MTDPCTPSPRMTLAVALQQRLETLADAVEYRVGETRDDQLANFCRRHGLNDFPRQSQTLLAAYIRVIARHAEPGGEKLRGTYAEMLRYLDYLGDGAPRFTRRPRKGEDPIVPYDKELIRKGVEDIAAFVSAVAKSPYKERLPFPGGTWRLSAKSVKDGCGVATIRVAVWDEGERECLSEDEPAHWVPLPQAAQTDSGTLDARVEVRPSAATSSRPASEWSPEERARERLQELPTAATDFVGRSKQIAEIHRALKVLDGVPVVAISGMPGVGKSELAITIARLPELNDRFHQYAAFYPFPRATEVEQLPTPRDVMAHCLRGLGVARNATESVEARFQQELANASVLLILDNLPDGWPLAEIRPPAPTAMLITARSLVEYPGVVNVRLRPLSMQRSRELLVSAVARVSVPIPAMIRNQITSSNANAAAELAAKDTDLAGLIAILCGGLPLAIRAASGVLANLPDMAPETYVTRLLRETERLKSLKSPGGGPYSVEAAFRVSYDLLNADERTTFRRMGYFSGEVEKDRAAKGLGVLARECLPELVRRNLVESHHVGSYKMHDLLRLYARQLMSDDDRQAVERPLVEYWFADAADHYDEDLRSLGQTEWHPSGIRVKLRPTEDDLEAALRAASGKREKYVPMLTLRGASGFGNAWAERGIEVSRKVGDHAAEALHHLKRGQLAERQGLIPDRTSIPGLRASRITHPAARSALQHYSDGMTALRGAKGGNAWLVLMNLLRHQRRMQVVLGDHESVITVSRALLRLPLRLPQWQIFASYQGIADAYFNRGDLLQSEIYAHRALNAADADLYELDQLRVHPLNLLGDIELLRGHRENALAAYTAAESAGDVSNGSEQLGQYWSPGWNLSHELQDRTKVYTFHESYLMRALLSAPVRTWSDVLAEHLQWYGYRDTWPNNARFDLRVAHAYLVVGDTFRALRWLNRAVEACGDYWSFAAITYLPRAWVRGNRLMSPKQRAATFRFAEYLPQFVTSASPLLDRFASTVEKVKSSDANTVASEPEREVKGVNRPASPDV